MDNHDRFEIRENEDYYINLRKHVPKWAEELVKLYHSPLKYKIRNELGEAEKQHSRESE